VGAGIGYSGLSQIVSGEYESSEVPGRLALFAAIISIIIKECIYRYMRNAAKRTCSDSIMAVAWHNRADSLVTLGSLAGIIGAQAGASILDPLASVIICLFVIKAALSIFREAISKMVDRACDPETADAILGAIRSLCKNSSIGQFRTRLFGDKIYVDVELIMPGDTPLENAFETCTKIQETIEHHFDKVKECHITPAPIHR
jgi:cation diffusion facilitator family transporter